MDKMLSLEKVYKLEDLMKWINKVKRNDDELFRIQPKLDGLAARFYRDSRVLSTRGTDGEFGQNITSKIKNLTWDTNITKLDSEYLDGELVISFLSFDYYNSISSKKYKSPRNLIAGLINTKDLEIPNGIISFVDYNKYSNLYRASDIHIEWDTIYNYYNSGNFIYPLDGIVIKLDDSEYAKSLGFTDHHPKGAISFKFDDQEKKSILKKIEWSCGKRKITPVGIIDPVIINGVTIERVSLHNAKRIIDLNLHINDYVYIVRKGDIIPHVIKCEIGENRVFPYIDSCPKCGSNVIYEEPELYCANDECYGNRISQINSAVKVLGIDELGEPTLEKILQLYDIENVFDLFDLSLFQIRQLEGFAEKSANTLYRNIQNCKNRLDDYKLLAALNLKGIGKGLSKELLENYTVQELQNLTFYDFLKIEGIGDERAYILMKGLKDNKELIDYLLSNCNVIITKNQIKPKGILICFSGKFEKPKSYYYALARQKGYNIIENITKDVKILVSSGEDTTKVKKAIEFNIPIATVEQFLSA
jgi:DNA ligase (NAD+)